MYEAHQIVGGILFGALGLYLVVFWGSALIAYIYGSYLHDGDKKIWSLPRQLGETGAFMSREEPWEDEVDTTYKMGGIMLPFLVGILFAGIKGLTKCLGLLVPYTLLCFLGVWLTLHTLRAVIRLNKKLDKHEKDTNAHKGE